MIRLFLPIGFLVVFVGWFIYHAFIKKDLQKQDNNFIYAMLFFIFWAAVYFLLLR